MVGYGNIGSQVSVMAEAMGMKVVYYDVVPKLPHGNATQARDLAELLKTSDVVTLHVPGGASTRNMINERTLAHLRRGALLINYSRGDVVDLDALKKYIDGGVVAGAAIDVFPEEPERSGDPFSTVLQNLPNVILTPHNSANTGSSGVAAAEIFLTNLARYVTGEPLHNGR